MSRGLSVSHLSYVYGQDTPFRREALTDVTFDFVSGAVTGIIGQTGSGKSTLLELIAGLLRPTSGRICLDGEPVWYSSKEAVAAALAEAGVSSRFFHPRLVRQAKKQFLSLSQKQKFRIGLVMQYPEYQLFDETVLSDMSFGPRNMGKSKEEAEQCAREAAALVGVSESWFDKPPFDLSGGEKRRVAIAGVLAMHPDVLILDEPAAGLDPVGRRIIFDGITDYNERTGATVIFVSHSMDDLPRYCRQIVVMCDGTVADSGTVADVFGREEALVRMGLDVPEVTHVAHRLQAAGIPLSGDLFTESGTAAAILSAWKEVGR